MKIVKSIKLIMIYGFLLWLIPFIVAIIIFPLKESQSPLFETIMPIALTICVVFFAVSYFRKVESNFLSESVKLGIIWFCISIAIDLCMFMWGPMKMSFYNYIIDIGLTYLIFPITTVGFGLLLARKVLNQQYVQPDSEQGG